MVTALGLVASRFGPLRSTLDRWHFARIDNSFDACGPIRRSKLPDQLNQTLLTENDNYLPRDCHRDFLSSKQEQLRRREIEAKRGAI